MERRDFLREMEFVLNLLRTVWLAQKGMATIIDPVLSPLRGILKSKNKLVSILYTQDPAYNEFGFCEHLSTTNRFLCIKMINYCNVKKFGYNEHTFFATSFFCIFSLIVSGTRLYLTIKDKVVIIDFQRKL